MRDLAAAGAPVDAVTLSDFLDRRGNLDEVGGSAKIAELAAIVPAAGNVAHYAELVYRHAYERRARKIGMCLVHGEIDVGTACERLAALRSSDVLSQRIVRAPIEEFASEREASAESLLGTDAETVLAAGGTCLIFGEGGSGKTTMEIDLAFHLACGIDWLGLHVERRVRVLLIEAEGPRGKFRMKMDAKLAAWKGPILDGYVEITVEPWATLTFADVKHRTALAQAIIDSGAEACFAGPVSALGLEGGGTPAEVRLFVAHLEDVRNRVGRPVAFLLIAHTNKGGQVAGAWEGATDTLVHAQRQGAGHSRLYWQKTRWASGLQGTSWNLRWCEAEGFQVEEDRSAVTEDSIAEGIMAAVRDQPGGSWTTLRQLRDRDDRKYVTGSLDKAAAVRDSLLGDGRLVNAAPLEGKFRLWAADDPAAPRSDLRTGVERTTSPFGAGEVEPNLSPRSFL